MLQKVKSLSHVRLFVTPRTAAYQAPPSMGFSRQEYWSALPFPSPGDLPNPGIEPRSPALQADSLPTELLTETPAKKKKCLIACTPLHQDHVYTDFPSMSLEQFLRVIWNAVSWAIVFIWPEIKLNSQLCHWFYYFFSFLKLVVPSNESIGDWGILWDLGERTSVRHLMIYSPCESLAGNSSQFQYDYTNCFWW